MQKKIMANFVFGSKLFHTLMIHLGKNVFPNAIMSHECETSSVCMHLATVHLFSVSMTTISQHWLWHCTRTARRLFFNHRV